MEGLPDSDDSYRKALTAKMLENEAQHMERLAPKPKAWDDPDAEFFPPGIDHPLEQWTINQQRDELGLPPLKPRPKIGGFENFVAPDLVSVQPMTAPVGGIAFYRPSYGSGKSSRGVGSVNDDLVKQMADDMVKEIDRESAEALPRVHPTEKFVEKFVEKLVEDENEQAD